MRGVRAKAERIRSEALLVRKVAFGDADLVVTLLTEQRGLVSAVARSGRRSTKRFASIEPMHLLDATFEVRPSVELATLIEVTIARPRVRLTSDLARLEAGGRALRWVRRAAPPLTPEPAVWREINDLLDALDTPEDAISPAARLAATGLRLLAAIGWGLNFERCVRCGKPCDESASACIDTTAGGLVCRTCGGARTVLRADRRAHLAAAAAGAEGVLDPGDVLAALALVDEALAAHAGIE